MNDILQKRYFQIHFYSIYCNCKTLLDEHIYIQLRFKNVLHIFQCKNQMTIPTHVVRYTSVVGILLGDKRKTNAKCLSMVFHYPPERFQCVMSDSPDTNSAQDLSFLPNLHSSPSHSSVSHS